MSEKFFTSTADPNVQTNNYPAGFAPFQKELLVNFLQTLLTLFYAEAEIMVCNFLVESVESAAFTDQQLAETLGLTQKQVRAALEARLMRDFVVESEQVNGSGSTWYRISPNVIIATEYRLSSLLKRLHADLKATRETEMYQCPVCSREYDLLRVISVANFRCEVCPVDAELVAKDSRAMKIEIEAKLGQFKAAVAPLAEALTQVRNMYVPRPLVVRKTLVKEQDLLLLKREAQQNAGRGPSDGVSVLANMQTGWKPSTANSSSMSMKAPKEAPEWLLLQDNAARQAAVTGGAREAPEVKRETGGDVRITAERLVQQTRKQEATVVDLLRSQPKMQETVKKEEQMDETTVQVRGVLLPLREVQLNEDRYIEQMTEEEFLVYDALVLSMRNGVTKSSS